MPDETEPIIDETEPSIDEPIVPSADPADADKVKRENAFAKIRTENATLKKQLDAANRAKLSETEQLRADLDLIKSELESERVNALKERIGNQFNLPAELAELLNGTDIDSISEHAARLAKIVSKPKIGVATNPGRQLAANLDEQILAAEKSGDFATSLSLKRQRAGLK